MKQLYKRPISVLLLSLFVFPGTGQFVNKHIVKGILVLLGTVIPFVWLMVYLILFFQKNFSAIFDTISGTGGNIAIPTISIPVVIILVVVFLSFYFYGIIDSYLVAVRLWEENKNK